MTSKGEGKKGLSLRQKRAAPKAKPVIGPPREIPMPPMPGARLPTGPNLMPPQAPEVRRQDKERVQEMVKKRMSTRFFGPGEIAMPDMPDMPDLAKFQAFQSSRAPGPPGPPGSSGRMEEAPRGEIPINRDDFYDPRFDPDQYVQTVLASASDEEVRAFQKRLKDMRARASTDLQKNVFVNRTQFILISKEIDKLKSEMRVLRGLLNELQNTTSSLKLDAETSTTSASSSTDGGGFLAPPKRKANRNSIADLTALHMTHLQLLWKQVEGSQKFLPAVPGRHIIVESRNWLELNAATWKPRRQIHMVLLNDHLLLAALKKKRIDQNSARSRDDGPMFKLVAERCWPLGEIEMVDLSPSDSSGQQKKDKRDRREHVSNAINIRVGKESFVFRNENADAKVKLLLSFKKTTDELRKAMRAESEDKHRMRDSLTYFTARDPALLEQGELLKTLSANMTKDQPSLILHVDGKPRNLRWLEDQMDELDESIAHRKFEEAVASIEELRTLGQSLKNNLLAAELINFKLDERASRLASVITSELMDSSSKRSIVKMNVRWLARLDFEDRARDAFFEARSEIMKKRTRQIQFEGDIPLYISQVALVQFTIIKNSVEIYNSCFNYEQSSALVKWAKLKCEEFAELLERQLDGIDRLSDAYLGSMDVVKMHSKMLIDVGLDFMKDDDVLKGLVHMKTGTSLQTNGVPSVGLGVQV